MWSDYTTGEKEVEWSRMIGQDKWIFELVFSGGHVELGGHVILSSKRKLQQNWFLGLVQTTTDQNFLSPPIKTENQLFFHEQWPLLTKVKGCRMP